MLKIIAIIFVLLVMLPFMAQLAMSVWIILRYPFMKDDERDEAKHLLPYAWGCIALVIVGAWLGAR